MRRKPPFARSGSASHITRQTPFNLRSAVSISQLAAVPENGELFYNKTKRNLACDRFLRSLVARFKSAHRARTQRTDAGITLGGVQRVGEERVTAN